MLHLPVSRVFYLLLAAIFSPGKSSCYTGASGEVIHLPWLHHESLNALRVTRHLWPGAIAQLLACLLLCKVSQAVSSSSSIPQPPTIGCGEFRGSFLCTPLQKQGTNTPAFHWPSMQFQCCVTLSRSLESPLELSRIQFLIHTIGIVLI